MRLAPLVLFASVATGCASPSDSAFGSGSGGQGAPTPVTTDSVASGAGGGGGGSTDPTPPGSCVQRGDKGNENGVGAYCSPTGGQCSGTQAPACLADLRPNGGQWFCTVLFCSPTNGDCGTDAVCQPDSDGAYCAPIRCVTDAGP